MVLAAAVLNEIVLLLEVLCAFDAVVNAEGRFVLVRNRVLELLELARIAQVPVHLVEGAGGLVSEGRRDTDSVGIPGHAFRLGSS